MLAIVILNYNGRKHLEQFLPSVVKYSSPYQIIIADNASTDDSVQFLQTVYPEIKLIINKKNEGFAGGYNTALKQIQAKYFLLLNSDVEVSPNWVEPLLKLMENNKQIAACQPKIRSFLQKEYFEYAGAGGGMIDYLGYPFCRGRVFDTCEHDTGQYDDSREVFWATGACILVRADIFTQLGGFDADFFAHMEEIDLCWRMKNAGYQIHYCAESTVFHLGGGTLNKSNPFKTYLNYRNGLALLAKNLPSNKLFTIIFSRLVLDGVSGVKLFLGGNFADVWAIIKAHFAFYAWLPSLMKKRSTINPKEVSIVYPNSIVWQYFAKGKKKYSSL